MTSIYLSSAMPRWAPKTEADIQAALADGTAEESHYLDFKESLAGKADNKELARDLASFAVDGGTLILGVAEDKANRIFSLAPQPLEGLAERVEQATRSHTDPKLPVMSTPIESAADPSTGYLLIHVPASPDAPHMVDGRFMGRGDKTKHTLSAPEVLRLHQRRKVAEADALKLLGDEIARDPMAAVTGQSHLFLLAQPQAGRPDLLLDFTSAANWNQRLAELIQRTHAGEPDRNLPDPDPGLLDAGNGYHRTRGIAKATRNLGEGRVFAPTDNYMPTAAIELQMFEDAGLRLFFSRLSESFHHGDEAEQFIWDAAAVALTRRFVAIVVAAAEEAGYTGNWSLAIGATGLRGRRAYPDQSNRFRTKARYDRDDYQQSTGTTWAELNETPGAVIRRLVGPLLRSLAVENRYDDVFKA
jgi:hypothetical protein